MCTVIVYTIRESTYLEPLPAGVFERLVRGPSELEIRAVPRIVLFGLAMGADAARGPHLCWCCQ